MSNLFIKFFRDFFNFRNKYFVSQINHGNVVSLLSQETSSMPRYVFLIIISMTIATLGILIGSSTFILGAMLIFPLMSVIASLGFNFCTLNYKKLKYDLKFIVIGIFTAILTAYLIVTISPLKATNDLILARTHPNLFDLLVAISGGLAAGYTHIKSKGSNITAVAISTSLSPPLAVIGFGLAINDLNIAKGSAHLFLTNLLAIGIAISIISKWYGFGIRNNPSFILWQAIISVTVFAILSIPLGITLKKISTESYIYSQTHAKLQKIINSDSKVESIKVLLPYHKKTDSIKINAIILTDMKAQDIADNLIKDLQTDLGIKSEVVINKISVERSFASHVSFTQK